MKRALIFLCLFVGIFAYSQTVREFPHPRIQVKDGKLAYVNWEKDVALWGVNYQPFSGWVYETHLKRLPLPYDFPSLKKVIDEDFMDFPHLGVNIIRITLTPSRMTDKEGNIVENTYVKLLDYLLFKCRNEGIYVHLTLATDTGKPPYEKGSFAADNVDFGSNEENSKFSGRKLSHMIYSPEKRGIFLKYVKNLFSRVNKFTGTRYADEDFFALVEIINEPPVLKRRMLDYAPFASTMALYKSFLKENELADTQEAFETFAGKRVKSFIDGVCEAVKSARRKTPVFWSYNWRGFMADKQWLHLAVCESLADGVSYCLYPGQDDFPSKPDWLNLPEFTGKNYLPYIAATPKYIQEVLDAKKRGKAVAVYEFETWCNRSGYLYPAMSALFKSTGAQTACMWTYVPRAAAEYNFCLTHFLNIHFTPKKALSFIIGAKAFSHASDPIFNEDKTVCDFGIGESFFETKSSYALLDGKFFCVGNPPSLPDEKDISGIYSFTCCGDNAFTQYGGNGIYGMHFLPNSPMAFAYHDVLEGDIFKIPPMQKRITISPGTGKIRTKGLKNFPPMIEKISRPMFKGNSERPDGSSRNN